MPESHSSSLYLYFVVGVMASALMPYEIYFHSSGGVEEGWDEKDLGVNRLNAIFGYGLGAVFSLALMVVAAEVLLPAGVDPSSIGTAVLAAQIPSVRRG